MDPQIRVGYVLQGRFKAILVEKGSYLFELTRYVVLNPVRAKTVRHPRQWPWSSYCATAGEEEPPVYLTTPWILEQFGINQTEAAAEYRRFVNSGRDIDVWSELRGGILLGSDEFVEEMRPKLREHAGAHEITRRERVAVRPGLDAIFRGTETKEALERQIHLAVRQCGYTLAEVAERVGMHYSAVSRIAKKVDDR